MRLLDQKLNALRVFLTERVKAHGLRLQVERTIGHNHTIELLLLIALARLLDDDAHRKMLDQSGLELVDPVSLNLSVGEEVFKQLIALTNLLRIALECRTGLSDGWLQFLHLGGERLFTRCFCSI